MSYMDTVSYTLRIPTELLDEIDATAEHLGLSRAQVVIKRLEGSRIGRRSVYLMSKGNLHKIGISIDPKARKTQVGSGVELVWSEESPFASSMELAFHAHFADKRKHGEWFELTQEDVEWVKEIELYHPVQGDFVSAGVSCKCHPPKFVVGWKVIDWERCASSKFKKTGWNKIGGDSSVVEQRKTDVGIHLPNPQVSGSSPDPRSRVAQCLSAIDDGAKEPNNASSARLKPIIDDLRAICAGNVTDSNPFEEDPEDSRPRCCECDKQMVARMYKGVAVAWACSDAGCPMYGQEQKS